MPNTSGYTYSDSTPKINIPYIDNKDGLSKVREAKGLMPFGPQTGVIEESDLNPAIVEWLLSKKDDTGKKSLYGDFLVKDKVAPPPAQ
jgi:hypothetical protein